MAMAEFEEFSFGAVILHPVPGKVRVESVELVNPTAGLRVRHEALVLLHQATPVHYEYVGYPTPGATTLPLSTQLRPGTWAQVLIGLTADGRGRYRFDSVNVTYRFNRREYLARYPFSMVVDADVRGRAN